MTELLRKNLILINVIENLRLEFVYEHVFKDESYWSNVIFCDELKFNIFGSDGRIMVWRKPCEENFKILNMVKDTLWFGAIFLLPVWTN